MEISKHKFDDPVVWKRLNDALSVGAYIEDACAFAGISSRTFRNWREMAEKGVEPYQSKWEDITLSESTSVIRNLANIRRSADNGSWQASAWILERKYPDKFGRRETVKLEKEGTFDVELYWSDGGLFKRDEDPKSISDISDVKKEDEEE